jgi:hypothetical protein
VAELPQAVGTVAYISSLLHHVVQLMTIKRSPGRHLAVPASGKLRLDPSVMRSAMSLPRKPKGNGWSTAKPS